MTRIFLNELKNDERQLPVPEGGRWKPDAGFLEKFAHDIYVKGDVGDRLVNSVPSVFARPIQFYQALSSVEHPMHATIIKQWRGLLAVFALQRALQIPVRATRFTLRDEVEETDPDRQFFSILKAQAPKPAEEWASWLLIYADDQLVGATSPWTIVYTPTEYTLRAGVPWVDAEGLLTDPFASLYEKDSDNQELRALLTWLDIVIARHPWGMPVHHEPKSGAIARELRAWRDELRRVVQPITGVRELGTPFGQATSAYASFLAPLLIASVTETVASGLQLADDDNCDSIVLSRTALTNPKWAKQRVYGGVRVEHLDLSVATLPGASGAAGWKTRTGVPVAKPYVIAEEYFLSERLLAMPLSDAAQNVGSSQYALPLTPAFLKHFGVSRLNDGMVAVEESAEGVSVHLRLPLKNGSFLDVERRYRSTDIEHIPDHQHIPALAIWPDFYDPEWADYDVVLVDAGPHSPRIRYAPLLPNGATAAAVALSDENGSIGLWRQGEAVLGFSISVADPGQPPRNAGIVLRRNVTPPRATGRVWDVGVDFGTSNTQIKVREREQPERSLTIAPRVVLLTRATTGSRDRLSELYRDYAVTPPFPTLLTRESVLLVKAEGATQESVGILPLTPDPLTLARGSRAYVRDIKWTADENAQKQYLQALARFISAEARAAGVGTLRLHWSYPLSLPARIRATMETFWSAVGSSRSRNGLAVEGTSGASESDAVSRYVTAKDVLPIAADSLSIGVDVGGGSTDAAFWSGQTLIDRVSLNVAANDIIRMASGFGSLNQLLAQGGKVGAASSELDEFTRAGFSERPEIMWNAMLLMHGRDKATPHDHPFVTALNMQNTEDWRKCRTAAFLALGGVCFYLGIHAGAHISSASSVAIYLGGRGSSVFSWIASPGRLREVVAQQFLQGLKMSRPDAKPDVEIAGPVVGTMSKALLKDEVAGGLIERKELTAPTRDGLDISSTLAGEVHWSDAAGKEIQWQDVITTSTLAKLKAPANHNSSFIAYFLKQVARPVADQLNLDAAGLGTLQLSQNWAINDMRIKQDEYVLQPIFGYELKSLIRKYADAVLANA